MQEDFILCAYTLGASDARIFFKYVLPVLKPRLLAFSVQQMTNTLLLIIYLGIFQIFIGGKSDSSLDIDGTRFLPLFGEWAGVIGESRNEIITAPWVFFGPLIVAVLFLIVLHLVRGKSSHALRNNPD